MIRNLSLIATMVLAVAALSACGDDASTPPGCVGASCFDVGTTDAGTDGGGDEVGPGPDGGDECGPGQTLVDGICVTASDSPFTCEIPPEDPCGGDLVGTWTYVKSCELETPVNPYETSCGEGAEVEHWYYFDYDGTLTFHDDGTYGTMYNLTTYSVSSMPITCGGYNDCDRLASSWGLGDCTEADQVCECSGSIPSTEADDYGGTYEVVNGTAVLFEGDDIVSPYCVNGDQLYLRRADIDTYEPLLFERQ